MIMQYRDEDRIFIEHRDLCYRWVLDFDCLTIMMTCLADSCLNRWWQPQSCLRAYGQRLRSTASCRAKYHAFQYVLDWNRGGDRSEAHVTEKQDGG
jgi:hypothetical protein